MPGDSWQEFVQAGVTGDTRSGPLLLDACRRDQYLSVQQQHTTENATTMPEHQNCPHTGTSPIHYNHTASISAPFFCVLAIGVLYTVISGMAK